MSWWARNGDQVSAWAQVLVALVTAATLWLILRQLKATEATVKAAQEALALEQERSSAERDEARRQLELNQAALDHSTVAALTSASPISSVRRAAPSRFRLADGTSPGNVSAGTFRENRYTLTVRFVVSNHGPGPLRATVNPPRQSGWTYDEDQEPVFDVAPGESSTRTMHLTLSGGEWLDRHSFHLGWFHIWCGSPFTLVADRHTLGFVFRLPSEADNVLATEAALDGSSVAFIRRWMPNDADRPVACRFLDQVEELG